MISIKTTTVSETVLLEHERFVRKLARRLVRDESQADDLVQETWLAALRQQHALRGSLRAWLARVMGNLAANQHRARARRDRREAWVARDEAEPSLDDLAIDASTRLAITRAVMKLAEPYRGAVVLRFYEGLGPSDIATRLQVPVETVRTRLKRALAMLRRRLSREQGSERRLALLPLFLLERWELAIDAVRDAWRQAVARVRALPTAPKLAAALCVPLIVLVVAAWRFKAVEGRASSFAPLVANAAAADIEGVGDARGRTAVERGLALDTATRARPTNLAPRVLTGRTLDARGAPLPNVEVSWWEGSELNAGPSGGSTRSDERGVYSLADLPDTFVVDAANERARAIETVQGVQVASGLNDEVDLYLVPARRLRGTVVDERDSAVPNAELSVVMARGSESYRAAHHDGLVYYRRQASSVVSDERGTFELAGLHDGAQRVLARHPDFANSVANVTATTESIEIRLRVGIEGAVAVVDETGRPISGARVTVRGNASQVAERITGDDGRCVLPRRVDDVPFYVRVEHVGHGPVVAGPWQFEPDQSARRVVLHAPRELTGRVIDIDGAPLPGARLVARFATDRRRSDAGFVPLRELGLVARAVSDGDGAFHFDELPRARLQIDVQPRGETWPTSTFALDERSTRVDIVGAHSGGTATLELTVRDGRAGGGLTAFTATLLPQTDARDWGLTRRSFDAPGGRTSWSELVAGRALVFVDVPGFVGAAAQVDLVDDETRSLDVDLFPARDLRLRVVRGDGTPLSPANLLVTDHAGRPIFTRAKPRQSRAAVPVGPGGEAELCDLPATVLRVEVLVPGRDFGPSFEFDLARAERTVHTLVVADAANAVERRFELTPPEAWRGQRVDVFVTDACGRQLASYHSPAEAEEVTLQGGRNALYCNRDANVGVRDAWYRLLPPAVEPDGAITGEPSHEAILVPAATCSFDVYVAGKFATSVQLDASRGGGRIDLGELATATK